MSGVWGKMWKLPDMKMTQFLFFEGQASKPYFHWMLQRFMTIFHAIGGPLPWQGELLSFNFSEFWDNQRELFSMNSFSRGFPRVSSYWSLPLFAPWACGWIIWESRFDKANFLRQKFEWLIKKLRFDPQTKLGEGRE
jgi:hypothetical protein